MRKQAILVILGVLVASFFVKRSVYQPQIPFPAHARPAGVPLDASGPMRWHYNDAHSQIVVEIDTHGSAFRHMGSVARGRVFGNGFVVWQERDEQSGDFVRVKQGWLSGDQMQALLDFIAGQGFWEMELEHWRVDVPCGEFCRCDPPIHTLTVNLRTRTRTVEERLGCNPKDPYGLEGVQAGFAEIFAHIAQGAGAVEVSDYRPLAGCLHVSHNDDAFKRATEQDLSQYPVWPFSADVSLAGMAKRGTVRVETPLLAYVLGETDLSRQEAYFREGDRFYWVELRLTEIMPLAAVLNFFCPSDAPTPVPQLPTLAALPTPTPTPIPSGEWEIRDPLGDSGWVGLSPPYLGELYTLATTGSEKVWVAGGGVGFRQAGRRPEWWKLERAQVDSWGYFKTTWALALTGDDAGWAVGMDGWLAHFEGEHWQQVVGPSRDHLWDVQMLNPHEGWIVGENGTLWRYAGWGWVAASSPTTRTLYALDMVSSNAGWAVGREGVILRYDGTDWQKVSSPTQQHLRGMDMLSEDEGWAVGAGGTLVHYQAGQWRQVPSPVKTNLHAVSMLSASEGWAVGADGVLLHYDGQQWQPGPRLAERDLWDVAFRSPAEGWAVGESGTVLHYREGEWRSIYQVYVEDDGSLSVGFTPSEAGWSSAPLELRLRYDSSLWPVVDPATEEPIERPEVVEVVSADELWMVVNGGRLWHLKGGDWQRAALPDEVFRVNDIQMLHPGLGYAVGTGYSKESFLYGVVLRYRDGEWDLVKTTSHSLLALSMLSSEAGWAVGGAGTTGVILRLYEGMIWIPEPCPVKAVLVDIEMVSPSEGWIISRGTLLHYEQARWVGIPAYTVGHGAMDAIEMVSPDEGWIVGYKIWRYREGQWAPVINEDRLMLGLQDIVALSPDEAWAFSNLGRPRVLHYARPTMDP